MNHFKRAHYRQLTTHIFYLEKFSLAGRAINGTRNFTVLELFIDTMLKGHLNTVIRHDIWIYLVVWPYSEHCKSPFDSSINWRGVVPCLAGTLGLGYNSTLTVGGISKYNLVIID